MLNELIHSFIDCLSFDRLLIDLTDPCPLSRFHPDVSKVPVESEAVKNITKIHDEDNDESMSDPGMQEMSDEDTAAVSDEALKERALIRQVTASRFIGGGLGGFGYGGYGGYGLGGLGGFGGYGLGGYGGYGLGGYGGYGLGYGGYGLGYGGYGGYGLGGFGKNYSKKWH